MTKQLTKEQFCSATSVWNSGEYDDELAMACEPDEVVESRDTLADFIASRTGTHETYDTPAGTLYVWSNQQSRPGKRRGYLFVMEAGEKTFSFFDGEA